MTDTIIIQRIFAKYRKEILSELYKQRKFVLLHSKSKSGIKQVEANYSREVASLKYSKEDTKYFLNVFPFIIRNTPKVIIHEFSIGIASLIPTYIISRLLGSKFIIWGHGYNRDQGFFPESSIADKLRLYLIKRANAVILYGKEGKQKISKYVKPEKLFIAYNCLNTRKLNLIRAGLDKEGRNNVKNRIGFKHDKNLIFIGRMLKSKSPELLLNIYENLQTQSDYSLGIHFVGDGPRLEKIKESVYNKGYGKDIFFHGAIHDSQKTGELLYCSDLMVMPSAVGLALNHAYNFDCPVATYDQKANQTAHGPEIEYLIHGKTGFLIKENNIESMIEAIHTYFYDVELQNEMKQNLRDQIQNICSVDNFIKGFDEAINYVLT